MLLLALSLNSCFTGVESTKAITQKDVNKAYGDDASNIDANAMEIYTVKPDSFPDWEDGKLFYVTDDNIRLLFSTSQENSRSNISLQNKMLVYKGYDTALSIDGKSVINILFADKENHNFVLPTNKTIEEFKKSGILYTVPFLIDMDEIMQLRSMLSGKELYVKTSIWYDSDGDMIDGRKFVKVTVQDVLPGNKIFPYMVKFLDEKNNTAYLYMSSKQSSIQNRMICDLFSVNDMHERYESISDTNWELIKNGDLALDMTKDECRLSLGIPKTVDRRATHDGLIEYWTYDNGVFLIFEDGLLRRYRK